MNGKDKIERHIGTLENNADNLKCSIKESGQSSVGISKP